MRRLPLTLPMLAALGLLTGCGSASSGGDKSAADSAKADTTAPAEVPLTPKGAPKRADGYWEMTSVAENGSPLSKQSLCVGNGTEDHYSVLDQLAMVDNCEKKDITRTAAGWTFETRCKVMDTVTTQKGTISGNFRDTFLIDQTVTQSPNLTLKGQIRGKHMGACPAPFKPGDIVNADGKKLTNILAS